MGWIPPLVTKNHDFLFIGRLDPPVSDEISSLLFHRLVGSPPNDSMALPAVGRLWPSDTKWPKMKKTLFSFDRLNEKINAKPTLYSETSSWFITDILQNRKCVISFCPNLSSRIQADLFKLKDNLQLPNHVCLWSQSSTLKVDVCPGLVCKLNSGTISKYLALNKFERKINSNSNLANNVMSLTPRYTALARLTNYLNNENNLNGILKTLLVFSI